MMEMALKLWQVQQDYDRDECPELAPVGNRGLVRISAQEQTLLEARGTVCSRPVSDGQTISESAPRQAILQERSQGFDVISTLCRS